MNAEVKNSANFSVCLYEGEVGVKYIKGEKKNYQLSGKKGYAAVDCDNQIDMVNREKVEEFCKAAEKRRTGSSRYCCCI